MFKLFLVAMQSFYYCLWDEYRCSLMMIEVNLWATNQLHDINLTMPLVHLSTCVYTHHTPKGTAEEVKHFARDGGGACTNEPDMPSKGFLHFIEDKVIPK